MTTLVTRSSRGYLNPADLIARMQTTFAYVEITKEGAGDHVAAWMQQLVFVTEDGRCADAHRLMDQLEQSQDAACFIHFGNDLGADGMCLSMLMIPHQPLIIEGHGDDEKTWFLIYSATAALDYEVFEPESERTEARADSTGAGEYAAAA